jgi:hypothetical protein
VATCTCSCHNISKFTIISLRNKSNMKQWEGLITHRGPYDACQGVQLVLTALLAQIYGALSKVPFLYPTLINPSHTPSTESRNPHNIPSLPRPWILLGAPMRHLLHLSRQQHSPPLPFRLRSRKKHGLAPLGRQGNPTTSTTRSLFGRRSNFPNVR